LLKDAPDTVRAEDYLSRTPILLAGSRGAQEEIMNLLHEVEQETNAKEALEAYIANKELELLLTG